MNDPRILRVHFRTSLFSGRVRVYVDYDDCSRQFLLEYYSDEVSFNERDLAGKTRTEALSLYEQRVSEYLRSRPADFRNLIAVVCTTAPQGDHGLEGFLLGDEYRIKRRRDDSFIVYSRDVIGEWQPQGTLTRHILRRYFKEKERQRAAQV